MNDIRIEGIEELNRKFQGIVKAVDKTAKESLLKQAEFVRDRIKEKAPLGSTGNLKRSPMAKMMAERTGYPFIAIAGINRKIAPHAGIVEFGHGGPHPAPPHPYFRPAIAETMPTVYSKVTSDLKKGIEGAV